MQVLHWSQPPGPYSLPISPSNGRKATQSGRTSRHLDQTAVGHLHGVCPNQAQGGQHPPALTHTSAPDPSDRVPRPTVHGLPSTLVALGGQQQHAPTRQSSFHGKSLSGPRLLGQQRPSPYATRGGTDLVSLPSRD